MNQVSDKQLKANQQNAKKSSGPKTEKGKVVVAKNALKHGILSNEVVIETEEMGETKAELAELQQAIVDDLKPAGALEELLVDRIVTLYWRLRRVIKAESGAIRMKTDHIWFNQKMLKVRQARRYQKERVMVDYQDILHNSVAAKWTRDTIQELKNSLEVNGCWREDEFHRYAEVKDLIDNKEDFAGVLFFNELAKGKVEGEPDKSKGKKALMFLLDEDIKQLTNAAEVQEQIEEDRTNVLLQFHNIPSAETNDHITRYETTLENQLYKAINQLMKLQALRKGGRVISMKAAEIEGVDYQNGFVSQNEL